MIDAFEIDYLTSGRDIIRWKTKPSAENAALILADPDYQGALRSDQTVSGTHSMLAGIHFERLPGTRPEAQAIADSMRANGWNVNLYFDADASEAKLSEISDPPRVLHLATHGYFLQDQPVKISAETTRGVSLLQSDNGDDSSALLLPVALGQNPLLRSGIALAGANESIATGNDAGIVSADKVLGVNLHGTDLVVLSACETGIGDVQRGEGVFGLKRAFVLAGARSVLLSLWKVSDDATRDFMTDFYRMWTSGKTKSESLRLARQHLRARYAHPYFWAAFILVGDSN